MTTLAELPQGSIFKLIEDPNPMKMVTLDNGGLSYERIDESVPERRQVSLVYTYVRLSETFRFYAAPLDIRCTELETGAVRAIRDNLTVRVVKCVLPGNILLNGD